jgi:hypothetical protein
MALTVSMENSMKPPVNVDQLAEMWIEDSEVNQLDLQLELLKIGKLHSKYLRILTHHSLVSKKIMSDYNTRRRIKWEYYNGYLNNQDDLKKYNIEPMQIKLMKSEINTYLDSDRDLNDMLLKKVLHDEIVDFCKAVIKELGNRTFQIRAAIDLKKYEGGN